MMADMEAKTCSCLDELCESSLSYINVKAVFDYILLIFVVLYPSLVLCNEELSVCTYLILLVQEAKMNWEYVHAEGLRMRTGLKLVNHRKCSSLAVSGLPDHTSSFFFSFQ